MHPLLALLAAGALAAVAAGGAGAAASSRPVLALVETPRGTAPQVRLVQADPRTLRATPGAGVRLAGRGYEAVWSRSRDGSRVAVVTGARNAPRHHLVVVDARKLRRVAGVDLPVGHSPDAVVWGSGGRVLVLASPPRAQTRRDVWLDVVDPVAGVVRSTRRIGRGLSLLYWDATSSGVAALLAGGGKAAPARLVLASATTSRTIVLPTMPAATGASRPEGPLRPGLAVDRYRNVAYVVGPQGAVAQVGVTSGKVVQRRIPSMPEGPQGTLVEAVWAGDGRLLLGGERLAASGRGFSHQPLGLRLVNTRTWDVRSLDASAAHGLAAGRSILAFGDAYNDAAQATPTGGLGLRIYGRDGKRRGALLAAENVSEVRVQGGRAYAGGARGLSVVDLTTVKAVRTLPWTDETPRVLAGFAGYG